MQEKEEDERGCLKNSNLEEDLVRKSCVGTVVGQWSLPGTGTCVGDSGNE